MACHTKDGPAEANPRTRNMPLLTELDRIIGDWGYKHGAPPELRRTPPFVSFKRIMNARAENKSWYWRAVSSSNAIMIHLKVRQVRVGTTYLFIH
jgi:hypothetical protein